MKIAFLFLMVLFCSSVLCAQSILINGQSLNMRKCMKIDTLKTLSFENFEPSASVEMAISRGRLLTGGKQFKSVALAKDLKLNEWLVSERGTNETPTDPLHYDEHGDSTIKFKAEASDLLIFFVKGSAGVSIYSYCLAD